MTDQQPTESFAQFKNSFSYGSRTDLNFKFLKGLTEDEAAVFLQELLWLLGDSLNDGDSGRLAGHVRHWQAVNYDKPGHFQYDDQPFTPLSKPLAETRLGLLTSTGHFVAGQDPQPFGEPNMTQAEAIARIGEFLRAQPTLSEIPLETPQSELCVRHGGYDIRGVQMDANVALPYERLRELAQVGRIGALSDPVYSFVGACAQTPLAKRIGPAWAEMFQAQGIAAMLLVPV